MTYSFPPNEVFSTAARLYDELGFPPTLEHIARKSGAELADIKATFQSPGELLEGYYAYLVERCAATTAEIGGETAEERIGAYCFVMLDLLEEEAGFVGKTFNTFAARWGSPFRQALATELDVLLDTPDVPGFNQAVLSFGPHAWGTVEAFVQLMKVCLADTTPERARSTALLDKTVRFYAEIASNKTASRGFDVLRYAVEANYIPRLPFVSDWLFGEANTSPSDDPAAQPPDNG